VTHKLLTFGALALVASASNVAAERNPSIYPAALCAAFWLGYADYAQVSAYLDHDPRDHLRADAYRSVAYRLATAARADIDAYVSEQRPLMETMIDAVVYGSDGPSRDVFERLTKTCKDFGQEHPETRDL
jgi:hypothetical protein